MTDTGFSSQILHLFLGCFSIQLIHRKDTNTGVFQFHSPPKKVIKNILGFGLFFFFPRTKMATPHRLDLSGNVCVAKLYLIHCVLCCRAVILNDKPQWVLPIKPCLFVWKYFPSLPHFPLFLFVILRHLGGIGFR